MKASIALLAAATALVLPAAVRADPTTICAPYNARWAAAARSGSLASMKSVLAGTPSVCRDLIAQEKGTIHAVDAQTQTQAKRPPPPRVRPQQQTYVPQPQPYIAQPQPVDSTASSYDLDTQAMSAWSRQDYLAALRLWRVAAARGDAAAEYSIGTLYEHGTGVQRDYGQAMSWYQQAAAQNYAKAQNNIGSLYFFGYGVPQDDAEAVIWYQKAADQHGPDGEYALGFMYEQGRGVSMDIGEARVWYARAAADGDDRAKQWLQQHPE